MAFSISSDVLLGRVPLEDSHKEPLLRALSYGLALKSDIYSGGILGQLVEQLGGMLNYGELISLLHCLYYPYEITSGFSFMDFDTGYFPYVTISRDKENPNGVVLDLLCHTGGPYGDFPYFCFYELRV